MKFGAFICERIGAAYWFFSIISGTCFVIAILIFWCDLPIEISPVSSAARVSLFSRIWRPFYESYLSFKRLFCGGNDGPNDRKYLLCAIIGIVGFSFITDLHKLDYYFFSLPPTSLSDLKYGQFALNNFMSDAVGVVIFGVVMLILTGLGINSQNANIIMATIGFMIQFLGFCLLATHNASYMYKTMYSNALNSWPTTGLRNLIPSAYEGMTVLRLLYCTVHIDIVGLFN